MRTIIEQVAEAAGKVSTAIERMRIGQFESSSTALLVAGASIAIATIVIVKVVSQHVEQLHPVAELLGD